MEKIKLVIITFTFLFFFIRLDYIEGKINNLDPHLENYFIERNSSDEKIEVFIKSLKFDKVIPYIERLHGKIKDKFKTILIATIPINKLYHLSEDHDIIYIERAWPLKQTLDYSVPEINGTDVRTGTGIDRSYQGKDVIVGIVDKGIDYTHRDFRNSSGNTRILYLWDQNGDYYATFPPPEYDYGENYDQETLNKSIQESANDKTKLLVRDYDGHGTHIAGVAAGNGQATGNNLPQNVYIGVAPQADIIAVCADTKLSTRVVSGVNYIFKRAEELGKPAVVNLSLGSPVGPHDGTSLFEEALDEISGKGKIIVVSVGNEGEKKRHLSYEADPNKELKSSFLITADTVDAGITTVGFDIWYDTFDSEGLTNSIEFAVGVYIRDPENLDVVSNFVAPGEDNVERLYNTSYQFGLLSINAKEESNPNNQARHVVITISDEGQDNVYLTKVPTGEKVHYVLITKGKGKFDAWSINELIRFEDMEGGNWRNADKNITLTTPSTSKEVISVGSYYITRPPQPKNDPLNGKLSSFSGRGPTRKPLFTGNKPDITAPGEWRIFSSLSQDDINSLGKEAQDGVHAWRSGTSISSAHVAGAIALLLEKEPTLTPSEIKEKFSSTSRQTNIVDPDTGDKLTNFPDTKWGYGKIDVLTLLGGIKDTTAPTILGEPQLTIDKTNVKIKWTTDEKTIGFLVLTKEGPTEETTRYTTGQNYATVHELVIENLEINIPYQYEITVIDGANNSFTSTPYSFIIKGDNENNQNNNPSPSGQNQNNLIEAKENGCCGSFIILNNNIGLVQIGVYTILQLFSLFFLTKKLRKP